MCRCNIHLLAINGLKQILAQYGCWRLQQVECCALMDAQLHHLNVSSLCEFNSAFLLILSHLSLQFPIYLRSFFF